MIVCKFAIYKKKKLEKLFNTYLKLKVSNNISWQNKIISILFLVYCSGGSQPF
jgi:hypothetical protein